METEIKHPRIEWVTNLEELTKEEKSKCIHPKNTGDKDENKNVCD